MTTALSLDLFHTPIGATRLPGGEWQFLVWAPLVHQVAVHLLEPKERIIEMERGERGYFSTTIEDLPPGTRYFYRLDNSRDLPDPASRYQPGSVHGPSALVDLSSFHWSDKAFTPPSLERSIFYELHVGTFTPEGTFDAVIERMDGLVDLGITTLEIMPVAQFPGSRNWGYDGVFPFAPQNSYGGPQGLQRLITAAHERGLAVALDVVYNHLGPEGNYLGAYGNYFTSRYHTPWGDAINYDGAGSDEVRRFFIENALYWIRDYHFDVLRLDAVHGIFDFSARHFLEELKVSTDQLSAQVGRRIFLIAESDLNDSRMLLPRNRGGYHLDAEWSDDFHHSVHTLLTGEKTGYYQDFGRVSDFALVLDSGWCYTGQYSQFRQRHHGNSPHGISADHFVVCNQNHDQIGNRASGERLGQLVDFESLKLAAGITLLSPFVPLLFMGEEYGEQAPFQYFTSHLDHDLVEAVRRGRHQEFAAFGWQDSVPDPQDSGTFKRSKLQAELKNVEPHATLLRLYRELIRLRKTYHLGGDAVRYISQVGEGCLALLREDIRSRLLILFNFSASLSPVDLSPWPGTWRTLIDSASPEWSRPAKQCHQLSTQPTSTKLHPHSFIVLEANAQPGA